MSCYVMFDLVLVLDLVLNYWVLIESKPAGISSSDRQWTQGCVRGRHGRGQGQGQGSSRPRPQNFVLGVSSRSRPVLEDPIHEWAVQTVPYVWESVRPVATLVDELSVVLTPGEWKYIVVVHDRIHAVEHLLDLTRSDAVKVLYHSVHTAHSEQKVNQSSSDIHSYNVEQEAKLSLG